MQLTLSLAVAALLLLQAGVGAQPATTPAASTKPPGTTQAASAPAAEYDRTRDITRARLLLDPPLMDGPHVLVVWNRTGATLLTLKVPRSGKRFSPSCSSLERNTASRGRSAVPDTFPRTRR